MLLNYQATNESKYCVCFITQENLPNVNIIVFMFSKFMCQVLMEHLFIKNLQLGT